MNQHYDDFIVKLCCCHRNLHLRTHSCPSRRPSGLRGVISGGVRPSGAPNRPCVRRCALRSRVRWGRRRSEAHTSELQTQMRISYAVFCLKKTINNITTPPKHHKNTNQDLYIQNQTETFNQKPTKQATITQAQ